MGNQQLNIMQEIWKSIEGYEGYFEVSNLGNFRSLDRYVGYKNSGVRKYPGKSLKTEETLDGYHRILLMRDSKKKRFMCHRLVAETFIPNPSNKPFVNHIDGDKSNNAVFNLEWCTQSENELHAYNVLGYSMVNKTQPKMIRCIETGETYRSMLSAVNDIKKKLHVTACIEGIKKAINAGRPYHGFNWEFV